MARDRRLLAMCVLAALFPGTGPAAPAEEVTATVTIPIVTGQPGQQPFAGHPGWVTLCPQGDHSPTTARIRPDGTFTIERPTGPVALIAGFDRIETPPVIIPHWPTGPDTFEVPVACAYACAPPGYPDTWKNEHMVRDQNFWQTFIAPCTQLYGCSVFDGPKIVWWGNKLNVSVHKGGAHGETIMLTDHEGGKYDAVSAGHSDFELPRIGWRHGDIDLVPGRKYAIRIGGYRPHGGSQLQLDAFVRPDRGDGYLPGEALQHRTRTGGDLCFLMFGNVNGQLVENQIRSEEWELFIPSLLPARNWGQTFVSHGTSLAGVSFWGSNGSDEPVSCRVLIRKGGPSGDLVGPIKTANAHPSPERPIIRYPQQPGQIARHESFYELPCDFFQVAYLPDEVTLARGDTYYVEIDASAPLMMYADGDFYDDGFAYYEGLKLEEVRANHTFHSRRWTLCANIVTYENPGGKPTDFSTGGSRPAPGPDGNLVLNGGAEAGDFSWWQVISDPVIDPSTDIPDPPNHEGKHRFGISIGWNRADMGQYQEIPGIVPGEAYTAGMWAYHRDGTDESAEMLWCDGPYGGEEHTLVRTDEAASDAWRLYQSEPFRPTKSTVTLIVRYRHTAPSNIASIHVDDIYLKPAK
jgi:hypothetical protein